MAQCETKRKELDCKFGHRKRLKSKIKFDEDSFLYKYEVLEVLLFYVYPRKDTKQIAKMLLDQYGSIRRVFSAPAEELCALPNMGDSSVSFVKCIKRIMEFVLQEEVEQSPVINTWKKLLDYISIKIGSSRVENSMHLYLNKRKMLLHETIQRIGTLDQTPLYVREILRKAIIVDASAIIVTHNHPSGDPNPSLADKEMTFKLQQACEFMNIELIDHVIVANEKNYSFKSNGLL